MDALNQIARDSQIVVTALMTADGKIHLFDIDLVETVSLGVLMEFTKREASYLGTLGYTYDGRVIPEPANYEPATIAALRSTIPAFLDYAAAKLAAASGDSVDWLQKLMSLPDTRTN
ncbi:MAG: hypothetical protein WBE45_11020 [Terriglobales bacterium]